MCTILISVRSKKYLKHRKFIGWRICGMYPCWKSYISCSSSSYFFAWTYFLPSILAGRLHPSFSSLLFLKSIDKNQLKNNTTAGSKSTSYCWWFRNPANQLRLVVYSIIHRVFFAPSQIFGHGISRQPSTSYHQQLETHQSSLWKFLTTSSWWFQPIWRIWVNLVHLFISPIFEVNIPKNKNICPKPPTKC